MNSVMDKTRLVEKQFRDKLKKYRRRALIRKQNEAKKETEQNEKNKKRGNLVEDIDIGRFFELATTDQIYAKR